MLACAMLARSAFGQQPGYDFSFVQLGDARVAARDPGEPDPKEVLGEPLLRSMAESWKQSQRLGVDDVARPAFAVCTGNLTEFGAPGETWKDVERLYGTLGMPWYPVAGQRDNAWNPLAQRIARAHPTPDPSHLSSRVGSPTGYYSFEAYGCHFVVLDCATIQDPRPVIDVEQLNWLRSDLTLAARGAPVFLCLDQPLDSVDFAQPFQLRMLMDTLDGANIVLVLHGHGRTGAHRIIEGLDCVTCGGTIAASGGGERGYNFVSIHQDVLRVEYRSLDGARPQLLVTKSITPRSQQGRAAHFEFRGTEGFAGRDDKVRVESGALQILEGVSAPGEDLAKELTLRIDERPIATDWQPGAVVSEAERNRCLNAGLAPNHTWIAWFDPHVLAPGTHLLTVELASASGVRRQRTVRFYATGGPAVVVSRHLEPLGSNRTGLVLGTKGVRTTTAGYMLRMDDPTVPYGGCNKTVAGVLGSPAYDLSGPVPVLVVPAPGGFVCGLRADQDMERIEWRYSTAVPVYGSIRIADGVAYVGDSAGRMHAIDLATHVARWVTGTGGCSIEMKPLLTGELLVFGAWDGFVYALNKSDGTLVWKQPLQAADCTPVSIAGRILVCDAAGALNSFTRAGEATKLDCAAVSAIASSADGEYLYLRCTDDHLRKIKPDGSLVWDAAVQLGSIPVAPVEHDGVVVACSDRGLVSWVEASTGRVLGSYQATPGAFVMAPLVVDEEGVCWVGGMDGSLTGLRLWH